MRKLVILFGVLILACSYASAQTTVNPGDADVIMSGIGGSDKYVSAGAEITFKKEISGFVVVGTTNIVVTSVKTGRKGQTGSAIPAGRFN